MQAFEEGLNSERGYKVSLDRIAKEQALIQSIKTMGHKLFNDLGGYIYTEASQADEREKVVQFINTLVLNAGPAASHTP